MQYVRTTHRQLEYGYEHYVITSKHITRAFVLQRFARLPLISNGNIEYNYIACRPYVDEYVVEYYLTLVNFHIVFSAIQSIEDGTKIPKSPSEKEAT